VKRSEACAQAGRNACRSFFLKQTNKQTNKETRKQGNKQTNKQPNDIVIRVVNHMSVEPHLWVEVAPVAELSPRSKRVSCVHHNRPTSLVAETTTLAKHQVEHTVTLEQDGRLVVGWRHKARRCCSAESVGKVGRELLHRDLVAC
jgi:hypothetical protein